MVRGRTTSGFAFEIDEGRIRSKRFAKLAARIHRDAKKSGDTDADMDALEAEDDLEILILGEEQQMKLIEHCDAKAESGYASQQDITDELNEIITIAGEKSTDVKNS